MSVLVTGGRDTGRDAQLDLLRGVAVAGMFFFSCIASLSDALPIALAHNVPEQLLPGDFVLSLFLFCSGISLAMARSRCQSLSAWLVVRKFGIRICQMLLVSLFVTPFSVGAVFGMDEMMLNAVLTVPALLIIGMGRRLTWVLAVLVWIVQIVLVRSQTIAEVPVEYLGGYARAWFWLPIMLGGALVWSRSLNEIVQQLVVWVVLLAMTVLSFGWPDKMSLNVPFGVLSVTLGVALLAVFRRCNARCPWLEYFGSKPLRMWVLMFCLLGPVRLYAEVEEQQVSLSLSPVAAMVGSMTWMACCFVLSKWWDGITSRRGQQEPHA
jgi:hypothetical protein